MHVTAAVLIVVVVPIFIDALACTTWLDVLACTTWLDVLTCTTWLDVLTCTTSLDVLNLYCINSSFSHLLLQLNKNLAKNVLDGV